MTRAYIGLGSNLGDRLANLRASVDALRSADDIEIVAASSAYDTDPIGPKQPNFLNAVVAVETSLEPLELFDALKTIEQALGRSKSEWWGPREIDLDLLLYGDESVESPDLIVPHPEIANRTFVLMPLVEIAPNAQVPGLGVASELLSRIGTAGVRREGALLSD